MTDISSVHKTRIRSLLEAAQTQASCYVEIYSGGERVTMPSPRIVGRAHVQEVTGLTRKVFLASFDNAVVRSHFDGIEVGGWMLFDYQGQEVDRITEEHLPDKFFFDGNEVFALHEPHGGATIEIPEAINLVGNNSSNFGHWLIEHILAWGTLADRPEVRNVPILIDADLHPNHREALEVFVGGRASVIALPKDAAAKVGRLWCVAHWIYVPIYWRDERAIHVEHMLWPPHEVAQRYRKLAGEASDVENNGAAGERLFFSRHRDRHRKLINIEEIEEIARDRGFHICYPEDLPFRKQLQIVRGATHVMAPEGSAIFLAFFARRGTKLLCLDHPFVEKSAFVEALFRELQIETVLVTGNCVREDSLFSRFSDYVIDPSDVRRVLAEWKSAPARSRSE